MIKHQIKAVLFDAFGTLCHIENSSLPYRLLMKRWPQGPAACYQAIMTRNVTADALDGEAGLSGEEIEIMNAKIVAEIQSMHLYPEMISTLNTLRNEAIKIAVVSNLALPYGQPLRELLPFELDVWALSYEVGSRKPEEAIYHHVCDALEYQPDELLMVGDSLQNDFQMPSSLGMQALWLNRKQPMPQGPEIDHVINSLDELLRII